MLCKACYLRFRSNGTLESSRGQSTQASSSAGVGPLVEQLVTGNTAMTHGPLLEGGALAVRATKRKAAAEESAAMKSRRNRGEVGQERANGH